MQRLNQLTNDALFVRWFAVVVWYLLFVIVMGAKRRRGVTVMSMTVMVMMSACSGSSPVLDRVVQGHRDRERQIEC